MQNVVPKEFTADTQARGGTGNAPVAAFTPAQLTPTAGRYKIEAHWLISGAVEALPRNLKIRYNNADVIFLPTNMQGSVVNRIVVERVSLDGVNPVQLQVVANATAATVYTVILLVTRIG